jgi:hypothetical protein
MLCEKGMTIIKARNALSIPQNTKQVVPLNTQSNIGKTNKHYTNYGMTNHNVETCKKKKKQTMVATTEATQPNKKTQETSSYACHICGLNGHKITDCLKFAEMQKNVSCEICDSSKGSTCCGDTNNHCKCECSGCQCYQKNEVTEEHVFKNRKIRKAKNVVDWEKEEQLK